MAQWLRWGTAKARSYMRNQAQGGCAYDVFQSKQPHQPTCAHSLSAYLVRRPITPSLLRFILPNSFFLFLLQLRSSLILDLASFLLNIDIDLLILILTHTNSPTVISHSFCVHLFASSIQVFTFPGLKTFNGSHLYLVSAQPTLTQHFFAVVRCQKQRHLIHIPS